MHERAAVHLDGHPGGDDDRRVPTITRAEAEALFPPAGERQARVPYERIIDAVVIAGREFPHAVSLRAIWTPAGAHEVLVEVWERAANGHIGARTVAVNA